MCIFNQAKTWRFKALMWDKYSLDGPEDADPEED